MSETNLIKELLNTILKDQCELKSIGEEIIECLKSRLLFERYLIEDKTVKNFVDANIYYKRKTIELETKEKILTDRIDFNKYLITITYNTQFNFI
jgi:hypothetical protein